MSLYTTSLLLLLARLIKIRLESGFLLELEDLSYEKRLKDFSLFLVLNIWEWPDAKLISTSFKSSS